MLIPLHRPSRRPIWVGSDHIWTIEDGPDGNGAIIRNFNGTELNTRETPGEILAMLGLPGPALPPKHPAFQSLDDANRYLRGER